MTIYKDKEQVRNFISNIPKTWDIYIHIDKKSNISIEEFKYSNVYVIKKYNIYWGSIFHLKAFLSLLKEAHPKKYDYYHLVTGQDFPCLPLNKFDSFLGFENKIYIEVHKLPYKGWKAWNYGYSIFKNRTLSRFFDIRKLPYKILNKLFVLTSNIINHLELPSYPLYGGVIYSSLTDEAVDFLLNSDFAKSFLDKLKWSLDGEELFIQTVLMNSCLSDKVVNDNLRYIDWVSHNGIPETLDESNFNDITTGRFLFCRKVDSIYSSKLIKRLINYIN